MIIDGIMVIVVVLLQAGFHEFKLATSSRLQNGNMQIKERGKHENCYISSSS